MFTDTSMDSALKLARWCDVVLTADRQDMRLTSLNGINILLDINYFCIIELNSMREKPCAFCTKIRELLLYTGHHTGRYDHYDMFVKVAPLLPAKMLTGTVSVLAGNNNKRCTLLFYMELLLHLKVIRTLSLRYLHIFNIHIISYYSAGYWLIHRFLWHFIFCSYWTQPACGFYVVIEWWKQLLARTHPRNTRITPHSQPNSSLASVMTDSISWGTCQKIWPNWWVQFPFKNINYVLSVNKTLSG